MTTVETSRDSNEIVTETNKTARRKNQPAPRRKIPSLLDSELLVALALLFFFFSLCRRSQRRRCYYINSAFPGAAVRCSCCGGSQRRLLHRACACYSSDCRQVDQSFPAGPGSTARVPYRRTRLDCFRGGEFAPLRFACAFGKHRSPLREHLGLPDAWLVVDSSLLARSPGDSRCLRV